MGSDREIIVNEAVATTDKTHTGSTVTLSGVRSVKFLDKGMEVVARILVKKFCPIWWTRRRYAPASSSTTLTAKARLSSTTTSADDRQIEELPVANPDFALSGVAGAKGFRVRVFKIYAPRAQKSKIALVAHRREVTDATIHTFIPEFAEKFYEPGDASGRGRNFVIKAYVYGGFFGRNVLLERGAFDFGREVDLLHGISQAQIEARAAEVARETVGDEITTRRDKKAQKVRDYVSEEAPWHAGLILSGKIVCPPQLSWDEQEVTKLQNVGAPRRPPPLEAPELNVTKEIPSLFKLAAPFCYVVLIIIILLD